MIRPASTRINVNVSREHWFESRAALDLRRSGELQGSVCSSSDTPRRSRRQCLATPYLQIIRTSSWLFLSCQFWAASLADAPDRDAA